MATPKIGEGEDGGGGERGDRIAGQPKDSLIGRGRAKKEWLSRHDPDSPELGANVELAQSGFHQILLSDGDAPGDQEDVTFQEGFLKMLAEGFQRIWCVRTRDSIDAGELQKALKHRAVAVEKLPFL